ncbi:MAG TPA: hypothetical protein DEH78_30340, partial [Solibacterales bacterium]|nr:hypothetical protein [Bryobacterales bacterium]
MRILALVALALTPAAAEVIDSVAATVGKSVITRSDAVAQIRLRAFIDNEEPSLSPKELRQAVDRLVDQALIRREIEISRYPAPSMEEVEPLLAQVRDGRFPLEDAYQQALGRAMITDEQLRQALLWQLTVLRFLEYRFRPAVQVTEQDMLAYYEGEFAAAWRKSNQGQPPPLDDLRDREGALQAVREA